VGWRGAGDDCGIGLTDGGGVGVVILYGVNSFATVLANCECPCSIFRLPYAASSFGIPHAPIPTTKPSLNSNHAVQLPTLPAIPHSTFISPSNPTARSPDSSDKTSTNALQPRNTKTTLEIPQPRHRSLRISDRMV